MKKLLIIVFVWISFYSHAQKMQEVDLSQDDFRDYVISLEHTGIKLKSKVPNVKYSVKIESEIETEAHDTKERTEVLEAASPCDRELSNIKSAEEESIVAASMVILEKLAGKEKEGECVAIHKEATEITTEEVNFDFKLEKNQNIYVTISRATAKGAIKTWQVLLRTPRSVNYISHFGFTFVPNGDRNADRFYAKNTAVNQYTITRMNDNGFDFWKDLSLTANYIIPITNVTKDGLIKFGWNGGFGLNGQAKFTVFTGPTILFSDFLSVNFNAGLHHRYKLKGEYEPGQQLSEALSIDQLNEQGLRPAFMISLGFRLSKEQLQDAIKEIGKK